LSRSCRPGPALSQLSGRRPVGDVLAGRAEVVIHAGPGHTRPRPLTMGRRKQVVPKKDGGHEEKAKPEGRHDAGSQPPSIFHRFCLLLFSVRCSVCVSVKLRKT
jgi:hypothetical protein